MAEPFIGQITLFAGNFAPRGWALCQGQILAIESNESLYSLIGTTYGGNGTTTFGLPDLRGRIPVGIGRGTGLSQWAIGERQGTETTVLNINQMPSHSHPLQASSDTGDNTDPTGRILATDAADEKPYEPTAEQPQALLNSAVLNVGNNQPHDNRAPWMALNYIIALLGIFPSRN